MTSTRQAKASRNPKDYCIATFGSHSALQILKGAKDEGFNTLCMCLKGKTKPYKSFPVADEIMEIEKWEDFFTVEEDLMKKNAILIPHGSSVAYIGEQKCKEIRMMHYGTKAILEWESNRDLERKWLLKAGLKLPNIFKKPEDIDRPVIVKFHGASGGFGYFIAKSAEQFYEVKNRKYPDQNDYIIQEYIVGVPLYAHYFTSPLTWETEIMSFDKRYESNADSIGRIKAEDQLVAKIHTSYTIVGNIPVVVRESLLPEFFSMGERVVEVSKTLCPPGLFGPFCLETIVTRKLEIFTFEISARIVAGTNPFVEGSPYTALRYKEPMSTGRRIARDIKDAISQGRLKEVFG
jgi:5-formaminoimidazole-4-carboxamide-1-(beta)-D-ribofuranosyl 5'-monophosphate synthetase